MMLGDFFRSMFFSVAPDVAPTRCLVQLDAARADFVTTHVIEPPAALWQGAAPQ